MADYQSVDWFKDSCVAKELIDEDSSFTIGFIAEKLFENCPNFKNYLINGQQIESVSITEIGSQTFRMLPKVCRCIFTFSKGLEAPSITVPSKFVVALKFYRHFKSTQATIDSFEAYKQTLEQEYKADDEKIGQAIKSFNSFIENMKLIQQGEQMKQPPAEEVSCPLDDEESLCSPCSDIAMKQTLCNIEHNFYAFARQFEPKFPVPQIFFIKRLDVVAAMDSIKQEKTSLASIKDGEAFEGLIIMEDIFPNNKVGKTLIGDITQTQAEKLADVLADMHGTLLAMSDQNLWKTAVENPMFDKNLDAKMQMELFKGIIIDERLGLFFEKIQKDFRAFKKFWRSKYTDKLGMPLMLTHGDVCMNNICWKKGNSGSEWEISALVDWKCAHQDNITADISNFLLQSFTASARKVIEQGVLERYFNRLNSRLEAPLFTFDMLHKAYQMTMVDHLLKVIIQINHAERKNQTKEVKEELTSLNDQLAGVLEESIEILKEKAPEWIMA